jgi:hypothetical protein
MPPSIPTVHVSQLGRRRKQRERLIGDGIMCE